MNIIKTLGFVCKQNNRYTDNNLIGFFIYFVFIDAHLIKNIFHRSNAWIPIANKKNISFKSPII